MKEAYQDEGKSSPIKIIVPIIIIAIIVIAVIIFSAQQVPNNDDISLNTNDQNFGFAGSLVTNGELTDSFGSNNAPLIVTTNSSRSRIVINSRGVDQSVLFGTPRITVRNAQGIVIGTLSASSIQTNLEGEIIIDLDLAELSDLNIDWDGDTPTGDIARELELEIVFDNELSGEVLTVEIPLQLQFREFLGTGCLRLSRQSITQTTHNGVLEISGRINNICSQAELKTRVSWRSDYMGSVEISLGNKSITLTPEEQIISENFVSVQDFEIIYMPNKNAQGKRANFSVDFGLENSVESILFDVVNENLEQCLIVTTEDDEISDWDDTATISFDASKCKSDISVFVCDNDYGCSGGAEGAISISQGHFSLSEYSPTKTISISRGEIPGVYGVTIDARVKGTEKTFISEKEIFVKPTDETITPNKFVISLLEGGKDSVRITNTNLAQEVEIETSVCNLFNSSFGTTGSEFFAPGVNEGDWLVDLATNQQYFAGRGYYQTALANAFSSLGQARNSAYSLSSQENFKIKEAYTYTKKVESDVETMSTATNNLVTAAEDLEDKLGEQNSFANQELTTQISGITASLVALKSSSAMLCAQITSTTSLAGTTASGVCKTANPGVIAAVSSLEAAQAEQCAISLGSIPEALVLANNIYSIYQQIDTMAQDSENIDATASTAKAKEAKQKITFIMENANDALMYIDLALEAAAIDSFESASSDDLSAKEYLELANAEINQLYVLVGETRVLVNEADDSLTTLQTEAPDDTALVLQLASALITLADMFPQFTATSELVVGHLETAQASVTEATEAAATSCAALSGSLGTCSECSHCCTSAPLLTTLNSAIGANLATATGETGYIVELVSQTSFILSALNTYQSFTSDYTEELTASRTIYTNTLSSMDTLLLSTSSANTYLTAAIPAAQNLSNLEKRTSEASDYAHTLNLSGEYNKERMTGLIATMMQNGFINGAYAGGVYTTAPTALGSFMGDCSKKVKLKLPVFRTNILQDVKPVKITSNNIIGRWNFVNAKVFDIFESQEAGIIFSNAGLNENTYATIEITAEESLYDDLTKPAGEFGPFNVLPKAKEDVSFKYHFKFNVKPRNEVAQKKDATCTKGLMFGNTGSSALPSVIMSWDWNAINSETTTGKYLDATQFAILLSKKLETLNNFLENAPPSCPTSPSMLAVTQLAGDGISVDESGGCFLPMTTEHYDGKPALYYFLDNTVEYPTNISRNFFEESISTADEMLGILDFDVYLMRDGLGSDFQEDFVDAYTKTLFRSSPSFVDPDRGMYRYFKSSNKFHFSSEAFNFQKDNAFILPDAGKYHVRLLAGFDDLPLMTNGVLNARIVVQLELERAVNSDYSPFYYTPLNGITGSQYENGRTNYGTSLSRGEGLQLDNEIRFYYKQRDSLQKLEYVEEENLFKLNSLNSKRARLLDYSLDDKKMILSQTLATPLLIGIRNDVGVPEIEYTVMKDDAEMSSSSPNLFLVTALENCSDFEGNDLSFANNIPDIKFGDSANGAYGLFLPNGENNGSVYFTTTAFTPLNGKYGLSFSDGIIETSNVGEEDFVVLEGVRDMALNDSPNGSEVDSLANLFDAVEENSVCVSRLGEREIYFWPEEFLFEEENIKQKITEAKTSCIS
jgi:hypothetical protein